MASGPITKNSPLIIAPGPITEGEGPQMSSGGRVGEDRLNARDDKRRGRRQFVIPFMHAMYTMYTASYFETAAVVKTMRKLSYVWRALSNVAMGVPVCHREKRRTREEQERPVGG